MDRSEIADVLNVSENNVKWHWADLKKSRAKHGIELYKSGLAADAEYGIKFPWNESVCWNFEDVQSEPY